ncbi:facilitated trehalose transporter Tret1-like [Maniola hyperantus]|uniref:facilitated trehalose transporter Tret1-like n=1 Tax=Aphantopus hyperantus TaxID=2795564 RepID=UPI001568A93E|nr:facilitated trehalose transporter Tret1-like [Maniola hyperantus]
MKKYYGFFKEGTKVNQIICAVLINLPVFAYGASIGWMSPMTLLLQSKDSPRGEPLTDIEVSWMAAVAYLTCIPGNFLMAFLGDTFGRKITLIFISSTGAASWILMLSSFEVWALILARALVGITMSGCYVTCPIYTKEISDDGIRGALGCLVILFHTSGNLFLYVIGDLLSYRTVLWICLSLPTFHLILFMMMPDSPSFLMKRCNVEEAVRVMAWLRCKSEDDQLVKNELEVIKKEQINDKESNRFLLRTIIKDNILSKAFYIALIVTLAREVCGAVPVLNFAGEIFAIASTDSSLVLSPNQQAILLGVVQVAGSMLASSIVEKAGRKPILSITSLISGLSMCALASWFVAKGYGAVTPNWIPIVTLCVCIFCDACGLQPISIVIAGEIFSYKYRGTVMAITMSVASFFDFLQLLFFKPLANSIGIHVAFYFFGIVCIFMAIYVVIVIPETKGKSLVEIYKCFRAKKSQQNELVSEYVE